MTTEEKLYVDISATSKFLKNDFCSINGYFEQQIETYKHLQDTLCVLEGIVDVLDDFDQKIRTIENKK